MASLLINFNAKRLKSPFFVIWFIKKNTLDIIFNQQEI